LYRPLRRDLRRQRLAADRHFRPTASRLAQNVSGPPQRHPSHDTVERLFDRLDPQAFLGCFQRWVEFLTHALGLKHVAIDGKTLRHSGRATMKLKPLHIVSAWASEHHLTLGQVAVDDKSKEIRIIWQSRAVVLEKVDMASLMELRKQAP
jgi:hypothetical protein